jgi:DNA-binding NtrC family response regulator
MTTKTVAAAEDGTAADPASAHAVVRILVADDEESMRFFVRGGLMRAGYLVEAVASGDQAIAAYEARPFDLAVLDLKMPGADGLQVLAALRGTDPDAAVIVMTAHGTIRSAVDAIRGGAFDYVTKPFELDELLLAVERALGHRATLRENRELRKLVDPRTGLGGLVGQSPALRAVFGLIERLGGSDATVLITGESGTGKELVARALHARSSRAGGPFVTMQCAAVPVALFESELFGHEAGAFTGAVKRRRGLLEKAHGGTLFLDEVADMAPGAQAKLERALSEREIVPLGGSEAIPVDIRVVAATNRDLEALVREQAFRQELYWRLNVVPIHLPPLRERREDVPLLVDHFLARATERLGVGRKTMAMDAMILLARQPWSGNVRELQNLVERLAVLHPDCDELGLDDLPEELRATAPPRSEADPAALGLVPYPDALLQFERRYLEQLFARTGGNITEAARLAGLSRGHLHRKARQVGVEAERFRGSEGAK